MVVGEVLSSVPVPPNGVIVHAHAQGRHPRGAPAAAGPPLPTPAESQRKAQLPEARFENLARVSALHPRYFSSCLAVSVIHAGEMIPQKIMMLLVKHGNECSPYLQLLSKIRTAIKG